MSKKNDIIALCEIITKDAKSKELRNRLLIGFYNAEIIGASAKDSEIEACVNYDITSPENEKFTHFLNFADTFSNSRVMFSTDAIEQLSGPFWFASSFLFKTLKENSLENEVESLTTPFSIMPTLYTALASSRSFMDVQLCKLNGKGYELSFKFSDGPRSAYCEEYFKNLGLEVTSKLSEYSKPSNRKIIMSCTFSDAQAMIEKMLYLSNEIASSFYPPRQFNPNSQREQLAYLYDEKGGIEAAKKYVESLANKSDTL